MTCSDEQLVLLTGGAGMIGLAAGEPANSDRFDLKDLEKLPARDAAVAALTPGLYLRQGGTNAVHVQLLIGPGDTSALPPILVQEQGWRVVDGLHRLEAARLRGDDTIKARFLDCTDSEALVLAIKLNTTHGLPLSKADRVAGATHVLAAHPDWSDRAIAGITGLSANTIASLRNRCAEGPRFAGKRLGRDGRRRPVSAGEGRRRAAEYISAHPDAPLRQVAKETNVSLGTVHDVSARIRRGVDPERSGRGAADALPSLTSQADSTSLRRKKHADAPPIWSALSVKVANDPAIRYTQGGKEFLRWMALHAAHPDGWKEFIDAIPVHWLSVIAPIADGLSEEWALFADRLRNRHGAVG